MAKRLGAIGRVLHASAKTEVHSYRAMNREHHVRLFGAHGGIDLATVVAETTLMVGTPEVLEGASPTSPFQIVFEDDGDTGYLYAVRRNHDDSIKILDAVHLYTVSTVANADHPIEVKLVWDDPGRLGGVLIEDHCHALFDFDEERGHCIDEFPDPPAGGNWTRHGLSDELLGRLFRGTQ